MIAKKNDPPVRVTDKFCARLKRQAECANGTDEPLLMVRIGGHDAPLHAVRNVTTDCTINPSVVILDVDVAGASRELIAGGWLPAG